MRSLLVALALVIGVAACTTTVPPRETEPQVSAPAAPKEPPPPPAAPPPPPPAVTEAPVIETVVVDSIPESVRIGILLPLTGRAAEAGQNMLNAAQMAVFETFGDDVALLPFDTESTPEGAARAARDALDHKAGLILGPLLSTSVAPVAAAARERGVNVVTFSNVGAIAGGNVFQLGIRPEEEVGHMIAYAAGRGLLRLALLVPEDAFGQAVVAAAVVGTGQVGGDVARIEFFNAGSGDATTPVQNLSQAFEATVPPAFDSVLVAAGPRQMRAIAPLFPYFDLDPDRVQLIGLGSWRDPAILREAALRGAWFPGLPRAELDRFETGYRALFAVEPLTLAALSYDAVALAGVLALVPNGNGFSREMLTANGGFVGKSGLFRFRDDGLAERGLAVYAVGPQDFAEIAPAADSFEPPAF